MEAGFVADLAPGHFFHERTEQSTWVAGVPEPALTGGSRVRGRRQYPVESFRCAACGYLEFFAGAADVEEPAEEPEHSEHSEELRCLACGAYIPEDAVACPACGWTWELRDGGGA